MVNRVRFFDAVKSRGDIGPLRARAMKNRGRIVAIQARGASRGEGSDATSGPFPGGLRGLGGLRHRDGRLLPGSRVEHNEGHTDLRRNKLKAPQPEPLVLHARAPMAVAENPHPRATC